MNPIDNFIKEIIRRGYVVTFKDGTNGLVAHVKRNGKNVVFPYEAITKDYEVSLKYVDKEMNKLKGTQ